MGPVANVLTLRFEIWRSSNHACLPYDRSSPGDKRCSPTCPTAYRTTFLSLIPVSLLPVLYQLYLPSLYFLHLILTVLYPS